MSSPEKIEKFWAWWSEAEARIDAALRDPSGRRTAIDELHMRFLRLGLQGDVVPRADGSDLIVGSAGGDPHQRIVAAHWLLGAPESSGFGFATHRPAQPVEHLMTVSSPGDPPLPIASMRFTRRWRPDDDLVDLVAWVGEGVPLSRAQPLGVAVLRSALGELEMESWVGSATVSGFLPDGAVDLAELMDQLVRETAERAAPQWYLYEYAKPDGSPFIVTLRRPLHPARHPFLDACVTIRTELQSDDVEAGDRIQGQLLDGIPGDVLPVGSITDRGWRMTFIYANRRSPSLALLRQRADMLGGEFDVGWDPTWEQVRRLAHSARDASLTLVRTSDPRIARP